MPFGGRLYKSTFTKGGPPWQCVECGLVFGTTPEAARHDCVKLEPFGDVMRPQIIVPASSFEDAVNACPLKVGQQYQLEDIQLFEKGHGAWLVELKFREIPDADPPHVVSDSQEGRTP